MRERLFMLHQANDIHGKSMKFFILEEPFPRPKGWYVQAISVQWFLDRELRRAYPYMESGADWVAHSYTVKHCTSEIDVDRMLDAYKLDRKNVPTFQTIWDLYKAMGYDYKKKRYI